MIFHITYLSGEHRVKAYLALPPGLAMAGEALQSAIEAYSGGGAQLPAAIVTEPIRGGRTASGGSGRFPALIYCRGGVSNFGLVRPHWVDSLASRGFVVFAPCYRGSEGGEGRDEFGGADREDVNAAYRLLQALPFVQADHITLMGFSRGAINAAITAAEMKGIRSLVLWGGVADLARTYEERIDLRRMLKRVLGGSPAKRPEAFAERSPLRLADRIRCPVLIIHGTRDKQVDAEHGWSMHRRLRELGSPPEMHLYEGCGHLLPYLVHEAAIDRMLDWVLTRTAPDEAGYIHRRV